MLKKLWIQSPFFNARGNYPLDMIVIHHIGSSNGKLYSVAGTITWFTSLEAHKNPKTGKIENQVSAHYILPRAPYQDSEVVQVVKDLDIAWHAGDSSWVVDGKTRKYINNYSVGIELEGDGNLVEYTDYQYETLIKLIKEIRSNFKIPENNIVGHEDIAPSRKVDPGKLFDWKRLRTGLEPPPVIVVTPATPAQPSPVQDVVKMQGGKNKVGAPPSFWTTILQLFLKIFNKS